MNNLVWLEQLILQQNLELELQLDIVKVLDVFHDWICWVWPLSSQHLAPVLTHCHHDSQDVQLFLKMMIFQLAIMSFKNGPTCSSVNFCFVLLADSLSERKYSFIFWHNSLSPIDPLLQDGHWHVIQAQTVRVKTNMTSRHSAVEFPTIAGTILIRRLRIKTAGIYKIIMIFIKPRKQHLSVSVCQSVFTFLIKAFII